MGTYKCSNGERVTQSQIDRRVKKAKAKKIQQTLDEKGYIVCEICNKNSCKPIDCSHTKSVQECKNSGQTELAWHIPNIKFRGRKCHQDHDKLGLQFTKEQ